MKCCNSPESTVPIPKGYTRTVNGCVFRTDVRGVIPSIIAHIYEQRVKLKQQCGIHKAKIAAGEAVLSSELASMETTQLAFKVLLNSCYGALGNPYFRYFDVRIAESVTLSGQHIIRGAIDTINDTVSRDCGTVSDYIIAGDTDSAYVKCAALVKIAKPKDPVSFLDRYAKERIEPALSSYFAKIAMDTNAYENRMAMKREAISNRAVWVAAKNYILNVCDNEGVRYAKPKIKVVGIKVMKASSPAMCRTAFNEVFDILMNGSEADMRKAVSRIREEFVTAPLEKISFPKGISDVVKNSDRANIYIKGCPYHVRAALVFNHYIKREGLLKKYRPIRSGDRIKLIHLRLPNPIKEDIIAYSDHFPVDLLSLSKYIDYDTQFEKAFMVPLRRILDAAGMKVEDTGSLEDFFS